MDFEKEDIAFIKSLLENTSITKAEDGKYSIKYKDTTFESPFEERKLERRLSDLFYREWNKSSSKINEDVKNILYEIPTADRIVFNYDHWWEVVGRLEDYNGYAILEKGHKKRQEIAGRFVLQGVKDQKQMVDIVWTKYAIKPNNKESSIDWFWMYSRELIMQDHTNGVRFYFNLKVDESDLNNEKNKIKEFIQYLGHKLNDRNVPFEFKIPQNVTIYGRNDVAVLYMQRNHFYYYADIIKEIYDFAQKQNILKQGERLPFTHQIFDGLCFAENPTNIDFSYGDYMTTIIAKLKLKYDLEKQKIIDISEYIKDSLCEIGGWMKERFNLFQNPYSHFIYDFSVFEDLDSNKENENLDNSQFKYLKAAEYVANQLCLEAIWNGSKELNWLCYKEEFNFPPTKNDRNMYIFLVDSQKAGIALFFKELAKQSNKSIYKKISELLSKSINNNSTNQIIMPQFDVDNIEEKELLDNKKLAEIIKKINKTDSQDRSNKKNIKKLQYIYGLLHYPFPNQYGNNEFDPTLETGLAGLGYAFLRTYDSKTPILT